MSAENPFVRPHGSPTNRRHVLLLQSWWEERVLRGVASYAAEHRWVLDSSMRWHRRLPPLPWHGDGIIAYAGMGRPNVDLLRFLKRVDCPVVETQGTQRLPHAGRVMVCNERIGRMGAEHLLKLNYEHLSFVTFEENAMESPRQRAFRETVEAAGACFHALTFAKLIPKIAALPRPIGLMATNDLNAINLTLALMDAGWRVPEEFAVLGVDDTDIVCELAPVPLSSVNCNYERQGYEAAALLDRLMQGEPTPAEPVIIEPSGVTVRRSTDTVALNDFDSARFLRHLRDHYLEPFSLAEAARGLGISLRKVQANFKRHLQHSVLDELIRLRVEHAQRLLVNPDLKIETISMESGFSNRFHFIRAFERVTGDTPTAYRRKLASG